MQGSRFIFQERSHDFNGALPSAKDDTTRQIERWIFRVIAGDGLQSPLAEPINDAPNPRPIDRVRAHHAWLGRCVKRRTCTNMLRYLHRRLRREKALRVSSHVAIRKIAVFGFNQHVACGAHENGAKWMIAEGLRATGNIKTQPQEFFVME